MWWCLRGKERKLLVLWRNKLSSNIYSEIRVGAKRPELVLFSFHSILEDNYDTRKSDRSDEETPEVVIQWYHCFGPQCSYIPYVKWFDLMFYRCHRSHNKSIAVYIILYCPTDCVEITTKVEPFKNVFFFLLCYNMSLYHQGMIPVCFSP